MAEKLKEKVKNKIKKEVELKVDRHELIKILSEIKKVGNEAGCCISKDFMFANSGVLIMLKELAWMGDNEIIFHQPETISKIEKLIRTIPTTEEIKFILKDNYFIIKSDKRNIKFKMSNKILLNVYNKMLDKDVYNKYSKLCNGAYIELTKDKFNEIITIADTLGSEVIRFTLNEDKTDIEIKLTKMDSSDEDESSVAYSEADFNIIGFKKAELKKELKDIDTFAYSPEVFQRVPSTQNFKFYFGIDGLGILLGEDGTKYAIAKIRD